MKYLLTVLLLTCYCANADVYKWTDQHGVVHYEDKIPANNNAAAVSAIELSPIQVKKDGSVINPQQKPEATDDSIQTLTSQTSTMTARQQAMRSLLEQWRQRAYFLVGNIQTKIDAWRNHEAPTTITNDTLNTQQTNKATNNTNHVEIYTAVWCGACKKAKQWLHEKNISFTEYDVEKDADAALRMQKLGGGGGIPFAVINNVTIEGFNAYRYSSALKQ